MEIDINDLSFNNLSEDIRLESLKATMGNPFDLPDNPSMMNPFTYEVKGNWVDGEHVIHNPFTLKIQSKVLIDNNKVIKAWTVNENNQYNEVEL